MKKLVVYFLALISVIQLSYAQEITIFGKSYSLLLVAPLFLIIPTGLFFLGLYLKDNYKKIFKFKLKVKKEKQHKPKKEIDFLQEVSHFESRINTLDSEESIKQFSGIVKDFLAVNFNLKEEYTNEELIQRLNKKVKPLALFLETLSNARYGGHTISKSELTSFIYEFKKYVSRFSKFKPAQEKQDFITRLRDAPEKIKLLYTSPVVPKTTEVKPREIKKTTKPNFLSRLFKRKKSKTIKQPITEVTKPEELKLIEPKPKIKINKINTRAKINAQLDELHLREKFKEIENLMLETNKFLEAKKYTDARKTYKSALDIYYKLPTEFEEGPLTEKLISTYEKLEFAEAKDRLINNLDKLEDNIQKVKPIQIKALGQAPKAEHIEKKAAEKLKKDIINSLSKAEEKPKPRPVWEIESEKIKTESSAELKKLSQEEKKLFEKLSKL